MYRAATALFSLFLISYSAAAQSLPGTKPLKLKGDLAAKMVAGIDKYLMRAIDASKKTRRRHWKPDFSSPKAFAKSVAPNRDRFRKIIGVVDKRLPPKLEYIADPNRSELVAETKNVRVFAVRWSVLPGMNAEGLLLQPKGKVQACAVGVPDADMTPEQYAGLTGFDGRQFSADSAFPLRLAESGCQVLIPALIDRKDTWSGNPNIGRLTNQPHREFVYRMAYQMGRHIIGYEVQKVMAAVDWFTCDEKRPRIGVFGYGEGGLIAFHSGACDERIDVIGVSGYFGAREKVWKEPIYRNVWGLLHEFGDAEIGLLISPRNLVVESSAGPMIAGPPPERKGRRGAAPGSTLHFGADRLRVSQEVKRLHELLPKKRIESVTLVAGRDDNRSHSQSWMAKCSQLLLQQQTPLSKKPTAIRQRKAIDATARVKRQFDGAVAYTQSLLPTAVKRREQFWSKLDTSTPEKFKQSSQQYRDYFHDEVIGKLPRPTMPMNPRTRLIYQTKRWKGYEVVLDLYEDVICHGILLVPNDIKPGERRPVVVCQHGLEGRPTDVCAPDKKTRYYNSFGAQLADLGYVVFAPQNPYIGRDAFRVLVRKGNPLKISLYSFIYRQHERILDWLITLPFVDSQRIAYYGLSYGGKVAMRIGALLERYGVVICSGDFNEWIWKNINLVWRGSYMFTIEYEMYEFDLGNKFNYAEMARLIAPRAFMVERGHQDGVGLDEWVAHEYARVRNFYARLKMPERTEIEFFSGGHEIHGQGTFRFLDRFLKK